MESFRKIIKLRHKILFKMAIRTTLVFYISFYLIFVYKAYHDSLMTFLVMILHIFITICIGIATRGCAESVDKTKITEYIEYKRAVKKLIESSSFCWNTITFILTLILYSINNYLFMYNNKSSTIAWIISILVTLVYILFAKVVFDDLKFCIKFMKEMEKQDAEVQ